MKRALALLFVVFGCAHESVTADAAARTNALRAQFPPGKATRADVVARAGEHPAIALTRPSLGWSQPFIRDIEDRTGLVVARAEKYVSPMATSAFFTLAHVWYFYDRADVLVDVEWERMGD
jgi:hypothetical protein